MDGQVIITFKKEATPSQIETVVNEYHGEKVFADKLDGSTLSRIYALKANPGREKQVIAEIKQKYDTLLEYVHSLL